MPGSVLLFPLFDSTPGAGTTICVTNLETSNLYCPGSDFVQGDVLLHYQYVSGEDCLEFDRYELLSPGDTLCVIAALHNPQSARGFLAVSAADPTTGLKIRWDFLIGSAQVVEGDLNLMWQYTPNVFRARTSPGTIGSPPCLRFLTDLDDDGAMDLGTPPEYQAFPRELYLDSFFEERNNFANELTLMSTSGQDYINEVDFLFYNNSEVKFSRTFKFVCWWSGPLSEISGVVGDLNGDEEELGHPPVETGWAHIRGNRVLDLAGNPVPWGGPGGGIAVPPLLGVFAQFITSTDFAAGRALQYDRESTDGFEILYGNTDHVGP
jgi:hypothetical protein